MDIKVGFFDSGRELIISSVDSVSGVSVVSQSEVIALINGAMENEAGIIEFADEKGRRFLVRLARIAYIEVGNDSPRPVGFAG